MHRFSRTAHVDIFAKKEKKRMRKTRQKKNKKKGYGGKWVKIKIAYLRNCCWPAPVPLPLHPPPSLGLRSLRKVRVYTNELFKNVAFNFNLMLRLLDFWILGFEIFTFYFETHCYTDFFFIILFMISVMCLRGPPMTVIILVFSFLT